MNDEIIRFLEQKMQQNNIDCFFAAQLTGIPLKRIQEVFEEGAALKGSEFLYFCRALKISSAELKGFMEKIV